MITRLVLTDSGLFAIMGGGCWVRVSREVLKDSLWTDEQIDAATEDQRFDPVKEAERILYEVDP